MLADLISLDGYWIVDGFQKLIGTRWDQDGNFNIIIIPYRCTTALDARSGPMAKNVRLGETHCTCGYMGHVPFKKTSLKRAF